MSFSPTAALGLELAEPVPRLRPAIRADAVPFGDARVLVRLHGAPLGLVVVPLIDGAAAADVVAACVMEGLSVAIDTHVTSHGCQIEAPSVTALLRGFGRPAGGCPAEDVCNHPPPRCTVIVPTAGRPDTLRKCLSSMMAMTHPSFEVLVVDNRPADPTTREIVDEFAGAPHRVRHTVEEMPGSAVARNRGIVEADTEFVAFTDDDVVVDPGWLEWILEPMRADPRVGVVCGLILAGDLLTPAQREFEDAVGFHKGFERRVFDMVDNRADDRILYPFWGGIFGSGNSMAFRRDRLVEIGGFDPALGAGSRALGGTDIEAFTHLVLRGSQLVYEPRSICWHDHRRDPGSLERQMFAYGVGTAAILTKWALRDLRLWTAIGRSLTLVARRRHRHNGPAGHGSDRRRFEHVQLRGAVVGPFYYARSLRWASRLGLRDVLRGGTPTLGACADRPRICLRETLSADLRATLADERVEPRLTTIGAYLALRPGIQAVALFRISQWLLSRKLAPLAYAVALCATYLTGSEMAPSAVVGPGLTVNHPAGVVIHGRTIAGRNLRLHTGVVLGERSGSGRHGAPVLGDDVLIGAGAKVLGPIRIGDRVRIGANAVVIDDVPVDHHAVGVPAKILSPYRPPPKSDHADTR